MSPTSQSELTVNEELSEIQARVSALKDGTVAKPKHAGGRPRGSKNKPKQPTANAKRDQIGQRSEPRGNQSTGYIIPRNIPVTKSTPRRADRQYEGTFRDSQGDSADVQRPLADFDQPERDGREAEPAVSRSHLGIDQSGYGAARPASGISDTIKQRARSGVERGFEKLANLGKHSDHEPERAPRARLSQLPGVNTAREFLGDMQEEYARTFADDEIDERREEVIDMIMGYSRDLDEFLSLSNAAGSECGIWEMDHDEAEPIANIWLKRAKRDKRAAAVLRLAMEGDDYKRFIIVLGPRLWRTAGWYPQNGGFRMAPWSSAGADNGAGNNITGIGNRGPA